MRKVTDDDEYIYIYELTKIRELKKLVSNLRTELNWFWRTVSQELPQVEIEKYLDGFVFGKLVP